MRKERKSKKQIKKEGRKENSNQASLRSLILTKEIKKLSGYQ